MASKPNKAKPKAPVKSPVKAPVKASVTTQVNPALSRLAQTVDEIGRAYKSIGDPDFVKTGSIVMDALLGGGVPRGCFILWSSHSGVGKSTGSLFIAKSYCSQGLKVLYLDFEGGVNDSQLRGIGLSEHLFDAKKNPNGSFFCYKVQTYTDAEKFLDALITDIDLVIIDSVTALLPEKLKMNSVEDIQPGLQSRLTANLLLKYKATSVRNGTSWILINQMRTHIRFVGQTTEEEAGGLALKFYVDYRIMMKKAKGGDLEKTEITPLGAKKVPYGSLNEVWCIKSRYSRPFIPLQLGIVFGRGISNNYAYKDFLEFKGCIRKDGAWYTINVGNLSGKMQGEQAVIDWIVANREAVKEFIEANGKYRLLMNEKDSLDVVDENVISDGFGEVCDTDSEKEGGEGSIVVGNLDDENFNE